MPEPVELLPCGHCGTKMLQHKHCFSHPYPTHGDCILRHYSFDNNKAEEWNTRTQTEQQLREEGERLEAKWRQWPNGDAGDAIDYALDHAVEVRFFLEDWRSDDLADYEDYHRWLRVQRDGARTTLSPKSE